MEITEKLESGSAILTLAGKIDEQGADKLKEKFTSLKKAKPGKILINFSNVTYMGSSGIGKLLLLYKDVSLYGGEITITGLSSELRTMFVNLKLDTVFTIS